MGSTGNLSETSYAGAGTWAAGAYSESKVAFARAASRENERRLSALVRAAMPAQAPGSISGLSGDMSSLCSAEGSTGEIGEYGHGSLLLTLFTATGFLVIGWC